MNQAYKWSASVLGLCIGVLIVMAVWQWPVDWWLTPDQQGDRLMAEENYSAAAETYEDPMKRGAAYFRDAEFEKAAGEFGRRDDAAGSFNRGNSLVMMGKYSEAIAAYQRAIQFRPDWNEAKENMAIAVARRDKLAPPEDDAGGTGGKLGADEIVFDDRAKNSSESEEVEVGSGQEMSDESLRELWLQRVQTNPSDFLKIKFRYQLSKQSPEGQDDE